jgi:hypothetical protein
MSTEDNELDKYLKEFREQDDLQKVINSCTKNLPELPILKPEGVLVKEARLKVFLFLLPRALDLSSSPGLIEEAIEKSKAIVDALFEDISQQQEVRTSAPDTPTATPRHLRTGSYADF